MDVETTTSQTRAIRNLAIVLGDQLNLSSPVLVEIDPDCDLIVMVEALGEATHVWSHKARIVFFLSAMRHFRDELRSRDLPLLYRHIDDPQNSGDLFEELRETIRRVAPKQIRLVQPGEFRVQQQISELAVHLNVPLEIHEDVSFFSTPAQFAQHAAGRKQLRMEFFYREMRRRHDVLMDGDQPTGDAWNFDQDNRGSFGKTGPGELPLPPAFPPDTISREVIELVTRRFSDHPGSLESFDWPVTQEDAELALADFLEHRLPYFGKFQDAMWSGEPLLYHSLISPALNVKLLDPKHVVQRAEQRYRQGYAPLPAVEGFIRQILGWREYVRGVYWLLMPGYLERNHLRAEASLPSFYWTGETEMNCLREVIGQTLEYGYAHHIQRLMVAGLFPLLLGVNPREVHAWFLAVYLDAVEWVELPNTLGMSQYGDGGVMASKPYVATGKYIQRMSNYCQTCRYQPDQATGESACPFTTLYWDFLDRHQEELAANPRMKLQVRNLDRKSDREMQAIRTQAEALRKKLSSGESLR